MLRANNAGPCGRALIGAARLIRLLTADFSTTSCTGRLPRTAWAQLLHAIDREWTALTPASRYTSDTADCTHHETTTTPLRARYHRFTITNHYVRSLFPPRSQEKTA